MTTEAEHGSSQGGRQIVRLTRAEVVARVTLQPDGTKEVVDSSGWQYPSAEVELPSHINPEDLRRGRVMVVSGTFFMPYPEGEVLPTSADPD